MRTTCFLLATLVAAFALAQSSETITVSVVEVPVNVVDGNGNPVRGLTAANFELYDDGQKRELSSFDVIDFASRQSVRATSPLNPAARRTFLLLFDLSFSSPASLSRAQDAARAFVQGSVVPRDLVAVGTIDSDRGFRLLSAFTTDRNLVLGAIADPRGFRAADPMQIAANAVGEFATTVTTTSDRGPGQAEQEIKEMQQRSSRLDDQYVRQRAEKQITTLGGLARTLRSVSGRKQIILLSEGFDPRVIQGHGAKPTEELLRENEAAEHGEVWKIDSDSRFGSAEGVTVLQKMADIARRADVVVHAIDIQGLRVQSDVRTGARVNSNDALFMLAQPTGGTVFRNSNDLKSDFDRMLKQQEVVYVLAFRAPTATPGKPHSLKVRLVNGADGKVLYRRGYFEAGGENAIERTLSNAEIIMNDVPSDAVHVAALAAPFPTASKQWQVPVILEISGPDLVTRAKNNAATAEIFIYAFDDDGLVRDSLYQRMSLDMTKVGDKLRGGGIKYYGTLALPEGHYAVKSLVRVAETDAKGYARADIDVPKEKALALSRPFFYETGAQWLMVKGASHDKTNAAYPFEVNGESFIPTARPHAGKFAVFAWNGGDGISFETTPATKLVSQVRGVGNVTKAVFELPAASPAVEVVAKANGETVKVSGQ